MPPKKPAPEIEVDEIVPDGDLDDKYEKLYAIPEEDRPHYQVKVFRVLPEFDTNNIPVKGFQGVVSLPEFLSRGEELIMQRFGGEEYTLEVRGKAGTRHAGQYVTRLHLCVPGRPVAPGANLGRSSTVSHEQDPRASHAPAADNYQDGYRQAMQDLQEQRRREQEAEDRRSMQDTLRGIQEALLKGNGHGNGNGNGRGSVLETIEAIGKLKDVLGLAGGQGLDTMKLLELLDKREKIGEDRAQKFLEMLKQVGSDPESYTEGKVLDMIGEFFKFGQQEKQLNRAAEAIQKSGQPAVQVFVQIRDGVADILQKHLGMPGAAAAMLIRGARSHEELLQAIDQVVQQIAAEFEEEEDIVDETEQPGQDGPGPGDKPGGENK